MAIIHIKKHETFAMIDKRIFADKRLSWRALGLLSYLLSHPHDWRISTTHLANSRAEGIRAIRTMMKELIACGYAELQYVQDESGRMRGSFYTVSENPGSGESIGLPDA